MVENELKQRKGKRERKKVEKKDVDKDEKDKNNESDAADDELQRATSSFTHRLWTRSVIVASVLIIVYFSAKNKAIEKTETKLALVKEKVPFRMQKLNCSKENKYEALRYSSCYQKRCGRFIIDDVVKPSELELLLQLATNIINLAGSSGGASILDLHSGALSSGDKFVNWFEIKKAREMFTSEHLAAYSLLQDRIRFVIEHEFDTAGLHPTYPTFFSRITNDTANTVHDEYWHEHVDKETYPSFHYTSLVYFTTFNKDFKGGRFIFVDGEGENRTTTSIEPRKGRMCAFSSGSENRHHVEKVTEGTRFALTISFTCDSQYAIREPKFSWL